MECREITEIGLHTNALDSVEWHLSRPIGIYKFMVDNLLSTIFKSCRIAPSSKVLVVCGGPGYEASRLGESGAEVVNSDISQPMSRIALMRGTKTGANLSSLACDAQILPFRDKSFDLAVSFFGLHHVPDFLGSLSEICRVSSRCVALVEPLDTTFRRLLDRFTNMTVEYNGLRPVCHTRKQIANLIASEQFAIRTFRRVFLDAHRITSHVISNEVAQFKVSESFDSVLGRFGMQFVMVAERTT